MSGWIGLDLDGTLARYDGDVNTIGEPLEPLRTLVEQWGLAGVKMKIVTARVGHGYPAFERRQRGMIQNWLVAHNLPLMEVVACKDMEMTLLIDDRAVRARKNTGGLCARCEEECDLPKITAIISNSSSPGSGSN